LAVASALVWLATVGGDPASTGTPADSIVTTAGEIISLPDDVTAQRDLMLSAESRQTRKEAARFLVRSDHLARLPAYQQALAELESAHGCEDRKAAISRLVELEDERSIPSLRRFSELPTSGCGFLSLGDCYGCIRRPLREAIETLSGEKSEE
jgi:HEAT repeat protein